MIKALSPPFRPLPMLPFREKPIAGGTIRLRNILKRKGLFMLFIKSMAMG